MPNGATHAAVARSVTAGCTLIGLGVAIIHPPAVVLGIGAWVSEVAGPDLDHHKITVQERAILRRNKLLGVLFIFYWSFYQRVRPHRGVSHTWPAGPLERFVLALWPFLLLSVGIVVVVPDVWSTVALAWLWVFLGQSVNDGVHIIMDVVSTQWKRNARRAK
jgi:uncharacterized metal-binding protein